MAFGWVQIENRFLFGFHEPLIGNRSSLWFSFFCVGGFKTKQIQKLFAMGEIRSDTFFQEDTKTLPESIIGFRIFARLFFKLFK